MTHSVIDLGTLYRVSRKSADNKVDREVHDPRPGLGGEPKEAAVVHNKTPVEVEQALIQMSQLHRTWGTRKLLHQVGLEQLQLNLPQESNVCDMLKRNGLITAK